MSFCENHQPTHGFYAGCLVCALQKQSAALSRISYLCDLPNEMEVSSYDLICDEEDVVRQVQEKLKEKQ